MIRSTNPRPRSYKFKRKAFRAAFALERLASLEDSIKKLSAFGSPRYGGR